MSILEKSGDRAAETMNWLHEGDLRLVTKKRAIEAAEYYQGKYVEAFGKLKALQTSILAFAVEAATTDA